MTPRPFPHARIRLLAGRYELVTRIGRGGSAAVYRAREHAPSLVRDVCLKIGVPSHDAATHAALREEGRLLAAVRHPNVVTLHAMEEDEDGAPFLVLELIEGCNLRRFCRALRARDAALPDPLAVHVACEVLYALAAVQRALPGLVHRDVTPHNVLVSTDGAIKLADFGIARALDRARWTRPFIVKGKLGYMAPEQIRDEPLDARTDLFAVGVLLYELLTGVRPWGRARPAEELRAIAQGEPIPLGAHRPGRPAGLVLAVERLLAARPDARFASADEAIRALAPFGAGESGALRVAWLASVTGAAMSTEPTR